jgi:hypothetical protein
MVRLYGGARALAVLVAIAAAFVTVPQVAVILLVLGAIAGLGNSAEDNMRVMVIAIVLLVGSKSLEAIPTAGTYLATIFGGIGIAAFGSVVTGVVLGLYRRTMADFSGKSA